MEHSRKFRSKNPLVNDARRENPNPLDLSRLLANADQRTRFQQFIGRKLITPKYVSLIAFAGFNFPSLLESQEVKPLAIDSGKYYPDLVRVFYCNLEAKGSGLTSWVKGVPIKLSLKQVGEFLDIPFEGEKIHTDFLCDWEEYDKRDFYLSMCRYDEAEIAQKRQRSGAASSARNILSVGHLNVDDRLLHYVLCYVLVPKASNYSQINDFEMQILYAIKNNKPINWAYLVVNHMLSLKKRSTSLPFARQISRLLECCNVDTNNEVSLEMTPAENEIHMDILPKMGINWDAAEHVYKHRSDMLQPPAQEDEEPQDGEVTNQMIWNELRSVRGYMTERFDQLSARLDRLEAFGNNNEEDEE